MSFFAALLCTSHIAATSSLELPFSYLGVPGIHSILAAGSIIPVVYQSFGDGEKVIPNLPFMQREVFEFFFFESHLYMFISALAELRD